MRSTRPCRNADASRRRTRLGERDARERQLSPREAEVRRIADPAVHSTLLAMHRAGSPESCAVCEMNPEFFALLADATFRLKARMILVSRYFAPEERIALFETHGLQTGGRDETTTARLLEEAEEVARRKGRSARLRCGPEDRGPQTPSAGGYRRLDPQG